MRKVSQPTQNNDDDFVGGNFDDLELKMTTYEFKPSPISLLMKWSFMDDLQFLLDDYKEGKEKIRKCIELTYMPVLAEQTIERILDVYPDFFDGVQVDIGEEENVVFTPSSFNIDVEDFLKQHASTKPIIV